ncbi:FG-GAP-like repeat-containing protein [Bradyrhizobium cajani]|uniref:FG-GAP-like repeat-containing protein n=1 Tax=Bradyrhizobium cajani TaxID=1928661 RepID=UPI0020B360A1|nr:FG-GAP-like repeat-containing protein [Bradyrhizobium cajani]MCP3369100.1 FG-GAP-like repeat-containing protein [Bradyrhizobium cajani]
MPSIPVLPTLVSITGTDPSSTDAAVVHYTVTFSKPVSGVTVDQFTLATTGGISGAGITDITPVAGSNGASYTVTVNTGSGSGSLGLQLTGTHVHDSSGTYIGPFQSETALGSSARFSLVDSTAVGDVNGDGALDLVVLRSGSTFSYSYEVKINDGTGHFTSTTVAGASEFPSSAALADVNGDGKLDLLVSIYQTFSVSVRLGNGNGTFGAVTKYTAGGFISAVGDFNGDGKTDVLLRTDSNVSVLPGDGNGGFGTAIFTSLPTSAYPVTTGDFNGDGKLDLVTRNNSDSAVNMWLGNGDGTFQSPTQVGSASATFIKGDFNGDGKLDLAFATGTSVAVALGNGDGTFASTQTFQTPASVKSSAAADVNGDGKSDIVVVGTNSTLSSFYSRGDGTFGPAGTVPLDSSTGSVTVADLNGDGKSDVVVEYSTSSSFPGEDILLTAPDPTTTVYTINRALPPTAIIDADVTPGSDGNNYINAAHFHGGATTLTGIGNAGDTITVTNAGDNSVVGVATVGSNGSWSLGVSGLQDGSPYSYVATATDAQGHSVSGPAFTFKVDASAPVLAITGIANHDSTSNLIDIQGTLDLADAPATLTVSFGTTDIAVNSTDGTWHLDSKFPAAGLSYVTARLRDAAGNTGVSQAIPLLYGYTMTNGISLTNAIVVAAPSVAFTPSVVVGSSATLVAATVLRNGVEEDYGISTGSVVKSGGIQRVFGVGTTAATIEAGGYQDIRDRGIATDTVLYGSQYVYSRGTAAHTTVKAGANQFVASGGHATGTVIELSGISQIAAGADEHGATILGTQYLNGSSSGATIGAGGVQYDYGASSAALVQSGGIQHVYQNGSAEGTTIAAGGYQDVYHGTVTNTVVDGDQQVLADGTADGTTINAGGRQYVGSGGATTDTTIAAGGFQYVDVGATDSSAVINGGWQYVAGSASGATVSGRGEQDVGAGGTAANTHLDGGTEHVYAGGLAQNVDFDGSAGSTLVLDAPVGLTGTIANFGADDYIDFRNTVISSVDVDSANNLTVTTDGGQSYSWALLGQYAASSFVLASDGNGGTALSYVPQQQTLLAAAH